MSTTSWLSGVAEWVSDLINPASWLVDWIGGSDGTTKVSPERAMTYAAVYRAVSLISGQTATLPLHVYKRISDTERERVPNHPIETLFNRRANDEMDALAFVELFVSWAPLWGNGYAFIQRAGPLVVGLWPLEPWRVEPGRREPGNPSSDLVYRYTTERGEPKVYSPSDILHLKNLSKDGIKGRSIVTAAREAIGLGLSQQKFLANFHENNATPSGALVSKARLTRKAQRELRKQWKEMHGGPDNAGKTGVLHGDLDFKQFGMPLQDAQFIENRKFNVLEIARMFGVPPHLLFDLDRATYSNIEAQGIEWLTYGLRYWLTKLSRVADELFTEQEKAEGYYCEHETKALLMTDIKSRFEAYGLGLEKGFLNVNQVHRFENWEPIGPAGDVYRVQSNMVPADDMLLPFEKRNPPKPEPAVTVRPEQKQAAEAGDADGIVA